METEARALRVKLGLEVAGVVFPRLEKGNRLIREELRAALIPSALAIRIGETRRMGARFRSFLGLRSATSTVMALATSGCLLRYIIAQVAGDAIESVCGLLG